jgi:hypothetical protein
MLINNSAPEKDLGLVNGVGQSMASAARCIGPAIGGALWSLGVRINFLFLNFFVICLLLVLAIFISYRMPLSIDYSSKGIGSSNDIALE